MREENNKLQDTFHKNLQLFSPDLQNRLSKISQKELWEKINIIYTLDGNPVCIYTDKEQSFYLTSIQPIKESEFWCESLNIDDAGALFVYGCGFGYPLLEILNQKQPNTIVIIYEQNIYIFAAMLHYFDLEALFNTQKFRFFVGNIEDFREEFQQLFFTDVFLYTTAPFIAFTPTAQRNFKNEYLKIHNYIFNELSLNIFYLGNDHYDTLLGFHNLIANVKAVIENPYLNILKDKFKSIPAFIIANGPSLDKNINELNKIGDKGIIISTESAIIPLLKNKINPNIFCVVERTKDTYYYHFENINFSKEISLLALAVIDKNIFPTFSGPKIPIFRSTESINRWMNSIIGNEESRIDAGANVSHLAFELAVYLGCNPIVLVGQDFAYSPDGKTHSKDAIYHEKKGEKTLSKIKSRPIIYIEGNDGTQLPSIQLWQDFKLGLERKIASTPHVKVINATEGGAKIKGTTCVKLSTVIENYCTKKIEYGIDKIINDHKKMINANEREQKLVKLLEELDKYANKYRELCQIAVKGSLRSKKMLELVNQHLQDDVIDTLEEAYEDNYNDLRKFMADNLYFVFLQQVLLVGFHKMNRLGAISTPEKIKEIFNIYDELFNNLNLVSQSVSINFEIAIDKLKSQT